MISCELATYFTGCGHVPKDQAHVMSRCVNCLWRHGIESMEQLADMSPEQLKRVRNLGEKSMKLALHVAKQYCLENGRAAQPWEG